MIIKINNLTQPQEEAIKTMLKLWEYLGNVGSSRKVSFYADGDGNFRPKIFVDDKKPEFYKFKDGRTYPKENEHGEYIIDFDDIAWDEHNKNTTKNPTENR